MCRYHSPPPGPRTWVQAGPPKTLVQLFGGCRPSGAAPGPEVEAGPLRAARRRVQRGLEPLVLAGDVVRDQVDGDLQAVLVGVGDQPVERGQVAEERVDVARVGHVVAVVGHRRGVERRQPQRVHPEQLQVAQPRPDALQVADPVPVGIGERPDVDLVDHGVAPPLHGGILPKASEERRQSGLTMRVSATSKW